MQTFVHMENSYDQPGPNIESKMTRRSQHRIVKNRSSTSLVIQCLIICLPMQGTQVPSLVREDPTC